MYREKQTINVWIFVLQLQLKACACSKVDLPYCYNIYNLKCTPGACVFLDCFWAFALEPHLRHQYKQLPSICKHQITVTEKSAFIVHTGPCLCLALGLWNAPLRLLRGSLEVLHTKHPLEENLCLIYAFWTLSIFLTSWFNYGGIKCHLHLLQFLFVCSMILWSCWMAAGWSPKSTGLPANWIIPSSSTRPGSSSTWTQGCGTWRFTTMDATWRRSPITPSSRVHRCASAAMFFQAEPNWHVIICLKQFNSCDCLRKEY